MRLLQLLFFLPGMAFSLGASTVFLANFLRPPAGKGRHLGSLCTAGLSSGWCLAFAAFLWPGLERHVFAVLLVLGDIACLLGFLAVRNSRAQGYVPPGPEDEA